jgi:hypothetical protein
VEVPVEPSVEAQAQGDFWPQRLLEHLHFVIESCWEEGQEADPGVVCFAPNVCPATEIDYQHELSLVRMN